MSLIDTQSLGDYNIVLIECPLFNFNKELTQDLLWQSYSMRISSYQKSYGMHVYPFGGDELAADHFFLTKKINNKHEVICSSKYITYERCNFFNLNFPILSTLSSDLNPKFLYEKTKKYILEESQSKSIGYGGGLSSNSSIINKMERKLVRDFVIFTTCIFKNINNISEIFITGTQHHDFYKFLNSFGFDILHPEYIIHKEVALVKAYLQSMKQYNQDEFKRTDYLNSLWNKRIVYKFQPDTVKRDQDVA